YCLITYYLIKFNLSQLVLINRRQPASSGGQSLESRMAAYLTQAGTTGNEATTSTPKRPADMPARSGNAVRPVSGGVVENKPVDLPPEVVRSDPAASSKLKEELPPSNMARQMAARFKEMESQAGSPAPVKPAEPVKRSPVN